MSNPEKITHLKVPPHSVDAEQAVLSAVLLHPQALLEVDLQVAEFYTRTHQIIWSAVVKLAEQRKGVDLITVSEHLQQTGKLGEAGGIEYLSALVDSRGSAVNVAHYAGIVRGRAQERRIITLGQTITDTGYSGEGGTDGKQEAVLQAIAGFMAGAGRDRSARQVAAAVKESVAALEEREANKGKIHGMSTGFKDLDALTLGLQDGDLMLIAGRPSMGKTTIAMNIAEHVAFSGELVVVFSLEMSERKLVDRMVCSVGKVSNTRYRQGDLAPDEWDRITEASHKLARAPLYIDDNNELTSAQIVIRARRIAHDAGKLVRLVVVDYLALLKDEGQKQVDKVTTISRNLKLAAKALNCPLIALAQLNRELEQRPNKRPQLSDLRDSGTLEQDADLVLMMYRDEVYYPDSKAAGVAEAILRKARDGEIGTRYLSSQLHRNRFENLAAGYVPPQPELFQKGKKGSWQHDD